MDAQSLRHSHQLAHSLEKEWHHCLVQVGADGEGVHISLHLNGLWHLHGLIRLHLNLIKRRQGEEGFMGGQILRS